MSSRVIRPLIALALMSHQSSAQSDSAAIVAFHARATAYMKDIAVRTLPLGNTLVTWHAGGPVLFHTTASDVGGMKAGMLRNDRMIGLADVRWDKVEGTALGASLAIHLRLQRVSGRTREEYRKPE